MNTWMLSYSNSYLLKKADIVLNSTSEYRQVPIIRIVPKTGLQQEQEKSRSSTLARGRGRGLAVARGRIFGGSNMKGV